MRKKYINKTLIRMLRLLGYRHINYTLLDQNKYSDQLILSIIKQNGFIEMNKKGNFWINGFTLLEIIKEEKEDKNKYKPIKEIRIKHDIDNILDKEVNNLIIAGKVTMLQNMINYFNKI